jgi:hypothetical protein
VPKKDPRAQALPGAPALRGPPSSLQARHGGEGGEDLVEAGCELRRPPQIPEVIPPVTDSSQAPADRAG